MTDLASNPIYSRMIQGSRGLSVHICLLIAAGIGVFGGAGLYHLVTPVPWQYLTYFFLAVLLVILFPIFLPSAGMIMATRMIARHVASADFALVRISGMSEEEIVRGYIEGGRYRLRLWIGIGLGVFAAVVVMLFIGTFGSTPAVGVVFLGGGALLIYYNLFWPLWIAAGVWAALFHPHNALGVSAGCMMIGLVMTCMLLGCSAVTMIPAATSNWLVASGLAVLFVEAVGAWVLSQIGDFFRTDSARLITERLLHDQPQ